MNGLRNSIFNRVFDKCEKNIITRKLIYFAIEIGIGDFAYRICSKDYLEKRKKFFNQNKERIEKNVNILEDQLSKDIYIKMIKYRCERKRKDFPKYNSENIYFPTDIISLNSNETFIDCGAYIGDTVEKFLQESNCNYDGIVAFEPDKDNFEKLKNFAEKYKRIYCFPYGTWIKNETLKFNSGNLGGSSICDEGNNTIKVVNLDSIKECQKATFIKMDIEGSELETLKGAENIILKNKPKLAICIYHSDNDMIDIIEYIHKLIPEYKIYLRQHGLNEADTVIYCI